MCVGEIDFGGWRKWLVGLATVRELGGVVKEGGSCCCNACLRLGLFILGLGLGLRRVGARSTVEGENSFFRWVPKNGI